MAEQPFRIQLNYTGPERFQPLAEGAAQMWQTFLTLRNNLEIAFTVRPIDGPGRVLARATWTKKDPVTKLPAKGFIEFDQADLAVMSDSDVQRTIAHEIGHVLGLEPTFLADLRSPYTVRRPGRLEWRGPKALAHYKTRYPAATGIPIEDSGGAGTEKAHWEEEGDGRNRLELMSGYHNTTEFLGAWTIGFFEDIGYGVTYGPFRGQPVLQLSGVWPQPLGGAPAPSSIESSPRELAVASLTQAVTQLQSIPPVWARDKIAEIEKIIAQLQAPQQLGCVTALPEVPDEPASEATSSS